MMPEDRLWVDVSIAAKTLMLSTSTIHRRIKAGKLESRRPSPHSTQVLRISICQLCSPGLEKYPLDCHACKPI